jgi:outer membrane lipoprotein-sorting protein
MFLIFWMMLPGAFASRFIPHSFSANFEQVYVSTLTKKEKKSFGVLDYQFPGSIRFEVNKPNPVLFVSNPQTSWIYRPPFVQGEKGEVTIKKSQEIGLSGLLDSLGNGLRDNPEFTVEQKENWVKMVFSPSTAEKTGLKEGLLIFKDAKELRFDLIKEIEITYPDKKKVSFKLSKIQSGKGFDSQHFNFTVPENTNVSP